MTKDEIQAEWDAFIDYPEGSGKLYVTTTSALIFARSIVEMAEKRERDKLRTQNQALMEALERMVESVTGVDQVSAVNEARAALTAAKQAQPEPSDLRGIDACPVAEWVDLVKRGYVSRDECLIAVKDIPLWIAKNSEQAQPSMPRSIQMDKQREEFEAWVREYGNYPRRPELKTSDGAYHYLHTESEWRAWQAAQAAQPERAEDSVNAKRYLWLRDEAYSASGKTPFIVIGRDDSDCYVVSSTTADEAIDAAREVPTLDEATRKTCEHGRPGRVPEGGKEASND